jgi:hypothetical protein
MQAPSLLDMASTLSGAVSEGATQVNRKQARAVLLQHLVQSVTLRGGAAHLSREALETTSPSLLARQQTVGLRFLPESQ